MYTGILHGIYGLGAFASPLVATAMVTHGVPVCPVSQCLTSLVGHLHNMMFLVPPILRDQRRNERSRIRARVVRLP